MTINLRVQKRTTAAGGGTLTSPSHQTSSCLSAPFPMCTAFALAGHTRPGGMKPKRHNPGCFDSSHHGTSAVTPAARAPNGKNYTKAWSHLKERPLKCRDGTPPAAPLPDTPRRHSFPVSGAALG